MDNKKDSQRKNSKKKQGPWKWIVSIFFITLFISAGFSFLSNKVLDSVTIIFCLVVLLVIILIGILFDIIGVAITAVDERSIHGMASRRVKGAAEAIRLIGKADRVASICNDVIGDICGVVSGAAATVIASRILMIIQESGVLNNIIPILLSALAAALTVSGKAIGKNIAMKNSTQIVLFTGRIIAFIKGIFIHKTGKNNGKR